MSNFPAIFRRTLGTLKPLRFDNKGVSELLSFDPVAFRKTKHILRVNEFSRDLVVRRNISVIWFSEFENIADLFTKAGTLPVFVASSCLCAILLASLDVLASSQEGVSVLLLVLLCYIMLWLQGHVHLGYILGDEVIRYLRYLQLQRISCIMIYLFLFIHGALPPLSRDCGPPFSSIIIAFNPERVHLLFIIE